MGGGRGHHAAAGPGAGRGRGSVRPARPAVPARTAGALLPHPRLGAGRGGRAAGHAVVGLAGPGRVRGTRLGPDLAVPGGHQPLPGRAAVGRPAERGGHARAAGDPPEPTRLGEVLWLEPYPDVLLEGIPDSAPGPEARYQAQESISLAFIKALQLLPPRQRAVLILRDVLGFHASEVTVILGTSEESVTSALKRARDALQRQYPPPEQREPPPPGSTAERDLVDRLTRAFETADGG